jgi:hypothetical protein
VADLGPLDLWNAHDDGNGPGWTALIEIRLPQDVPIQPALEALRALGLKIWSTEIRRSKTDDAPHDLRLVVALRACDWHGLLATTAGGLSAHLRHEIAAGGLWC